MNFIMVALYSIVALFFSLIMTTLVGGCVGCAEDTDAMLPVVKDALRLAGWSFTTMMDSRNGSLL